MEDVTNAIFAGAILGATTYQLTYGNDDFRHSTLQYIGVLLLVLLMTLHKYQYVAPMIDLLGLPAGRNATYLLVKGDG